MLKIVLGSGLLVASFFTSLTGIGLLIGIPMAVSGVGMMVVGFGQLTKSTVKGGIAVAKFVNGQKQKSQD